MIADLYERSPGGHEAESPGEQVRSVPVYNRNSGINRVITTAAYVILSKAKNLRDDTAFLRDSSLRSE